MNSDDYKASPKETMIK